MRGQLPLSIGFLLGPPFFLAATARYARKMLWVADTKAFRFAGFAGQVGARIAKEPSS